MPHIQELPTTTKAAAPGWSYVVDTGYDPSKAAINPANRKRVRIATIGGPSANDLSARQQTAIQRHLDELDKDSHKAVSIAIPPSKRPTKKPTTNVRRVLNSGKDFEHYLVEEEAALALKHPAETSGGAAVVAAAAAAAAAAASDPVDTQHQHQVVQPKPPQRASKTPIARRKPALVTATTTSSNESTPVPTPAPSTPATTTTATTTRAGAAAAAATTTTTTTAAAAAATATATSHTPGTAGTMAPPPLPAATTLLPQQHLHPSRTTNTDLLLTPPQPATLVPQDLQRLISTAPLRYSAARSAPPGTVVAGAVPAPPQRVFCEICGYWGRARCMKCGARVCGLECQTAHDESRCVRF